MKRYPLAGILFAAALSAGCSLQTSVPPEGTLSESLNAAEASSPAVSSAGDSDLSGSDSFGSDSSGPSDSSKTSEQTGPSDSSSDKEFTEIPTGSGKNMIDYGNSLYLKWDQELFRIDKSSGQRETLFLSDSPYTVNDFCVYHGDVYALTVSSETGDKQLIFVPEEGGGSQVLKDIDGEIFVNGLYASDKILYLNDFDTFHGYPIQDDKSLGEELPADSLPCSVPEGFETSGQLPMIPYLKDHGEPLLFFNQSESFESRSLWIQDPQTGELRQLEDLSNPYPTLVADGKLFSYVQSDAGTGSISMYDTKTGEKSVILEEMQDFWPTMFCYQDGNLYFYSADSSGKPSENSLRIFCANTKTKELKELAACLVSGGTLYYEAPEGYELTLKNMALDSGQKSWNSISLFRSKIADVGEIQSYRNTIFAGDGSTPIEEIYLETLILDGSQPGDAAISRLFQEQTEKNKAYIESGGDVGFPSEEYLELGGPLPYTYTTYGSVFYSDGQYLCAGTSGYEYTGGAHGMPFRQFGVYDRQTGTQLTLRDLISNTEEELKDIVSPYFRKPAEAGATFYGPDEVVQTVWDRTTFDSDFYLSDGGLVFYYTPYDLGPYAAGFLEVTIPFDQFSWKIDLSAAE